MKKYKLRKEVIYLGILFIITIVALISFLISLFDNSNYSLEYNLENYAISENYDDGRQIYYYEIIDDKRKYSYILPHEEFKDKKLIKDIKKYEEDEITCLVIKSSQFGEQALCHDGENPIDIHLVPSTLKNKLKEYINTTEENKKEVDNYTIYNNEEQILLWSYKGFNYLNKNKMEFIKLFNKDIYDIPLATKINNYLFIPDYEQVYTFDKAYIINLDNMEIDKWTFNFDISFDSYILGINNKSIFLVDKKTKKEYEIVPHKKKMRIVGTNKKQGIIYKNGESEKISLNKLISNKYKFIYNPAYNYQLIDKYLYLSYLDNENKIKLSNNKIDNIITIDNDTVYYLIKDTLYRYNPKYGEVKLITYEEWDYNNKNSIFIV